MINAKHGTKFLKSSNFIDFYKQINMLQHKRTCRNNTPAKYVPKESLQKAMSESTDDDNSVTSLQYQCSDNEYELPHYSDCAKSPKYKTEMCKNYSERGYCPYYEKCQFAHGYHDLVLTQDLIDRWVRMSSKPRRCKNFWNTGQCSYGLRCLFTHYEVQTETLNYLKIQSSVLEDPQEQPVVNTGSRLLKNLYTDYSSLYSIMDE